MEQPPATETATARPPLTPRRLLGRIAVLLALAALLTWLAPFVLPVRVMEGPMVQMVTPDSVEVVWFTSRDTETRLEPTTSTKVEVNNMRDGRHHRATLKFSSPGDGVEYHIMVGQKELARGSVRTAKRADQPYGFIVFGDSGRASREQYQLAGQMVAHAEGCDFLIHTGDVVYPDGDRSDYLDRFFTPYDPLLNHMAMWPSLGNHDVSKPHFGAPYREVFDLPENGPKDVTSEENYWFDYANARFVIMNTNPDEPVLAQKIAPWLREVLASSNATWKFAVFHHPPYSIGKHGSNDVIQRAIVPVLEEGGVDVVFNGHDHIYQRTLPIRGGNVDDNGIVYVVSGAGGAELYKVLPEEQRPPWVATVLNARHSFTRIDIDGERLMLQQIDLNGDRVDQWETVKKH